MASTLTSPAYHQDAKLELNEFGCVPKLCGADIELGNIILGLEGSTDTGGQAACRLLRAIREDLRVPTVETSSYGSSWTSGYVSSSQDWGRTFLGCNGGCIYIDLEHLELCLPEIRSATDFVAAWHAMLRISRDGLETASARLPQGQKLVVLANNSDGQGHSYGGHVNVLVRRSTWDNMFNRRLHHALFLAAHQASSIVLTGAGKVGTENGVEPQAFVVSARGDFFVTLTGPQTTYDRPLVNTRDESLCGAGYCPSDAARQLARMHVIFYDTTLGHMTNYLKVGMLQIVLTMIEAERIAPRLLLEDPVTAMLTWSHDPSLRAQARLADGSRLTAVEWQLLLLEEARRFQEQGGFTGVVPQADQILALWEDTLEKLKAGDLDSLARRLDWVLKLRVLESFRAQRGLDWTAPELKRLDFAFSDLREGLYWVYERQGAIERLVTSGQIERFVHQAPEDTRAWTRAALLRLGDRQLDHADWDRLRFRFNDSHAWPRFRTLQLPNPLGFTRQECGSLFEGEPDLETTLDALEAT